MPSVRYMKLKLRNFAINHRTLFQDLWYQWRHNCTDDPFTGMWSDRPRKRSGDGGGSVGGSELFAVSGYSASLDEVCDYIEVFDLAREKWRIVGQLPYPLKGHLAFEYRDRIFLFSGQKSRHTSCNGPGVQ